MEINQKGGRITSFFSDPRPAPVNKSSTVLGVPGNVRLSNIMMTMDELG